jgi:hypothetical protein
MIYKSCDDLSVEIGTGSVDCFLYMRMETDPISEVLFQMKIKIANNVQKIDHFIIATITDITKEKRMTVLLCFHIYIPSP